MGLQALGVPWCGLPLAIPRTLVANMCLLATAYSFCSNARHKSNYLILALACVSHF